MRWSDLAVWAGPTPNQGGAMTEAGGLVLHVQEGSQAGSLAWSKNPASEVSAHFYAAKDGSVAQLVDTETAAWTQVAGNGHWLSVECEGYHTDALTPAQLEAVAQLYARGVQIYGWPLAATDSTTGRGLGWHGMGGDAWGGHFDCPGEQIKAQRPAILARAAQIAGSQPDQLREEPEMHRVRSGASDGSVYLVPGHFTPKGRLAAYGLSPALNGAYSTVQVYQLPAGMRVDQAPWYDVLPVAWPIATATEAQSQ